MLITIDGQIHEVAPDQDTLPARITVEKGQYHTFINKSQTEDLVIDIGLDPPSSDSGHGMQWSRDEQFFRTWYCYIDDCAIAKVEPNLFQLNLFLWSFDCYMVFPGYWPSSLRSLRNVLSKGVTCVLGWMIGKWMLGHKETYEEYFDPRHGGHDKTFGLSSSQELL